jgi:Zn-dependent protease
MIYLRFSKTEVLHLVIATALVTAVGMSIFGFRASWELILIFVCAFVVHELGHKFLAQFYRAWAEFRLLLFGAVITAFSALPFFPLKFIAPGVVWHSGNLSQSRSGKVSWIGPLTNLAMGTGFLVAYLALAATGSENSIMMIAANFNGLIAFFNMIPFFGLDGQKILAWNKLVWVLTFAAAIGLYIGPSFLGGQTIGFLRWFS